MNLVQGDTATDTISTKHTVRMVVFDGDEELDALCPTESIDQLAKLIGFLCGESVRPCDLSPEAKCTIESLLTHVRAEGEREVKLNYEQFNELLLLFNQDRVERPFFDFFFLGCNPEATNDLPSASISFSEVRDGVRVFRGFALLCFGNFRFAFRALREEKNSARFMSRLHPWSRDTKKQSIVLENRTPPLIKLQGSTDEIQRNETWYLGYLSSDLLNTEIALLVCISGKSANLSLNDVLKDLESSRVKEIVHGIWSSVNKELVEKYRDSIETLRTEAKQLGDASNAAQDKGIRNTIKYLTWDYLDVYVATSMRHQWEFEDTYDFVHSVFKDEQLRDLSLRWFDPTQSFDPSIIDKGLLEGLMLKRAKCTIYMAQEGDTLGKDSELAATLAQGKPVIAYVPKEEVMPFTSKLESRPLRYFRQRLLTLLADGFFDKPDNQRSILETARAISFDTIKTEGDMPKVIEDLLHFFNGYEVQRHFALIGDDEKNFRREHAGKIQTAVRFMAIAEVIAADNRAITIDRRHPLSMQVNLATGVANGVLVVRSPGQCAQVLRNILINQMRFDIGVLRDARRQPLATVLVEKETNSRFRVVTRNEALTNSFWNFYLEENERIQGGQR